MYGISVLFSSRLVSSINIRSYKKYPTKKLLEILADMPKENTARIIEVQHLRNNSLRRSDKYAPSTAYLQVIGSGARGAPNTLYLFTDQKRYLFNCGEATQRLAHEHKVKLSRLEHIFITSKTWKNIGGLPGLSLTLQDVGVPNITLHGPDGLDELYNATSRFVIMKEMQVGMAKCSPTEDFEDSVMSVRYIVLAPQDSLLPANPPPTPPAKKAKFEASSDQQYEEFIHDDTDYYRAELNIEIDNKEKCKTDNSNKLKTNPVTLKTEKVNKNLKKKSNCAVSYICTLKKRLGTLDLAKCVEKGVKPGPLLGQLKKGLDVLLPCGTLVLSKDVKTPDDPGPVFIVLDVPDITFLKEEEFAAYFDDGVNPADMIPTLIVHFTSGDVYNHPTYRAFMQKFGTTTRHLLLNEQNSCLGSESAHRTQHRLHLLDPDVFPLLKDNSIPAVWNTPPPRTNSSDEQAFEDIKNKIALAQFQSIMNMEGASGDDSEPAAERGGEAAQGSKPQNGQALETFAGHTLTMFHLRPKKVLDRSAEPKLHIQEYIQESMDMVGFTESLEAFKRHAAELRAAQTDKSPFPRVLFLGTGSCIPSKTRNTSGIALLIDETRSMIFDCGEGTFGQLVRFFGPKRVNAFMRTLKAIYVSHLHADHHIGLIGLLQARREAFAEINVKPQPVFLLAPGQIYSWLSIYDTQFETIRGDYKLVPNQNLLYDLETNVVDITSAVLSDIGVQKIETCLVSHCPNAFGVTVNVNGRHKITYSGDTIPSLELVKLGDKSTLLIHEATMEDELSCEARMKMHSTTSQAIDIGRQMRASHTLLTHFSQRYARLPRLNAHLLHGGGCVGVAFDNMQVTMSDLELLPHMYAPLQLMFAEHCVEMEQKAAQRAIKAKKEFILKSTRRKARMPDSSGESSYKSNS